jgi:hypothetical protein
MNGYGTLRSRASKNTTDLTGSYLGEGTQVPVDFLLEKGARLEGQYHVGVDGEGFTGIGVASGNGGIFIMNEKTKARGSREWPAA